MTSNRLALALALLLASSAPARALDAFEIQVYEGDINRPRQVGLEVHGNFVPVGHEMAEPPARVAADDLFRLTLEPSVGLLEWWELGAYLQFALERAHRMATSVASSSARSGSCPRGSRATSSWA